MSEERIQVWHFIRADYRTGERRLKVEVGQTLSVEGPLKLCKHGLHGSRKALDALYYAPGPVACLDEIWGDIIEGDDKLCGRYRKCLAMIDATYILHEFGCRCPERALTREREMGREPDPRSWAAIDAKRKWLRGEIDDAKLAAARVAAEDAARAVAGGVSWAAAEAAALAAASAAAEDAAWAAARAAARAARAAAGNAARAAAWAAAEAAAWAAARDAARAARTAAGNAARAAAAAGNAAWATARAAARAARAAAWAAETDWQNAELTRMLEEQIRRGRA
ncbi:hypothetical protein [Candidatus Darwinibacter acetoxidans]